MQRASFWFVVTVRVQVQSGDGTDSLPVVFIWLDFCFGTAARGELYLYGEFKVVQLQELN